MGNIVRSFIEEFVPGWASRNAIRRAAEPAIPDEAGGADPNACGRPHAAAWPHAGARPVSAAARAVALARPNM